MKDATVRNGTIIGITYYTGMRGIKQFSVPDSKECSGGQAGVTAEIVLSMIDSIMDENPCASTETYYNYVNYLQAMKSARVNLMHTSEKRDPAYTRRLVDTLDRLGIEIAKSVEYACSDLDLEKSVALNVSNLYNQSMSEQEYQDIRSIVAGENRDRDCSLIVYVDVQFDSDIRFLLAKCENVCRIDDKVATIVPTWLRLSLEQKCHENARGIAVYSIANWNHLEAHHLETSLILWDHANAQSAYSNYNESLQAARCL